jgi:4-methyl-5(b-hydroxyethyl)-thiazole monophosphate biosynthesis
MLKTGVLLYPQFSEYELSVALSVLMQGGKPVTTIGLDLSPVKGESGLTCLPDIAAEAVETDELDSLLLPGCLDIFALEDQAAYVDVVAGLATQDRVVAAISSSPLLLARAGILKGKKYTVGLSADGRTASGCFEEENYSDDLVVRDGNLITARGRAFIEFGGVLGRALNLSFDPLWYGR